MSFNGMITFFELVFMITYELLQVLQFSLNFNFNSKLFRFLGRKYSFLVSIFNRNKLKQVFLNQ